MHLENLAQEGNAEIVGYLRKWKTSQMLLHIAFFIDVLTPAAELSKIFQEDDIDIVSATSALNRTKHKLQLYSKLSLQDLPATKYLLSKVDKVSGTHTYQGIQFSSIQFERELELLKAKKNRITEAVCACISARLDDSESSTLQDISLVLNAESWMAKASLPQEDDEEEGEASSCPKFNEGTFDAEISRLFEHFQAVLVSWIMLVSSAHVQKLLLNGMTCLPIASITYSQTSITTRKRGDFSFSLPMQKQNGRTFLP